MSIAELAGVDRWWVPVRGNAWVLFRCLDAEDRSHGHYVRWYPSKRRAYEGRHDNGMRPIRLSLGSERSEKNTLSAAENAYLPSGVHAWVLFDTSNGDEISHRYLWWFNTRREATVHRRNQHAKTGTARLSRPVRMEIT